MKTVGSFISVGLMATALHFAVMTFAIELLGVPVVPAAALGFLAGAALNYVLNRRISFASQRSHREGLPRFALMVAMGVILNSLLVSFGLWLGWHYLPAQVMGNVGVMSFNFVCLKYWIFAVIEPEQRG